MRNVIAILLMLITLACEGQSGGVGFWNPPEGTPPPAPGDSVDVMYDGFFLASKEGAEEYVYSIPKNYPVLLKYKVSPTVGKGVVVAGAFTGSEFINPTEVKHAGGHLFVMDRGGTRITRINMSNYSDKTVVFNAASTPYPFFSFTPLLEPGQSIGMAKIFGLYYNEEEETFSRRSDSLVVGCCAVSDWFIMAEATAPNWVTLRSGVPLYGNSGVNFPAYSLQSASINSVIYNGVARLVTTRNLASTSGYRGGSYILDSDVLDYGRRDGMPDQPKVTISTVSGPFLSGIELLLASSPVFNIGSTFAAVSTSATNDYGRYTSIHWIDNTITSGMLFQSTYWSGIINSTETAVYYIMKTNNSGDQKALFKQYKNGTVTNIRIVNN